MSEPDASPTPPQAVLLDIEGTTTPIRFVYDELFPFARKHAKAFLRKHWGEAGVQADLALLREEHARDDRENRAPPVWDDASEQTQIASATAYVHWLMDRDRKSTGLKSLQGKIWRAGYESGELKGRVYDDVAPALERWTGAGRRIYIFSSGSVAAQKLLFGHSDRGDLRRFLSGYFDTTTGPKREAASYAAIAREIETPPEAVLFVSDVEAELDAARETGVQTRLCVREAEIPGSDTDRGHIVVRDFTNLP